MPFNCLRQAATRSICTFRIFTPHVPITASTTLPFWRTYSSTADDPPPIERSETKKPPNDKDASKDTATNIEESLKQQLAEKDKKLAELQDAYMRCLADQENVRERTRKELASAKEFAIQKFAKDLLDTVDILNMALTSVPEELRTKEGATRQHEAHNMVDQLTNLYVGVSMTEVELVKALKRHGVDRHDPEGQVFDPNLHQALFQTHMPDKSPGTIFSVQKMGYTLKGRVLRPAQVGVVAESK